MGIYVGFRGITFMGLKGGLSDAIHSPFVAFRGITFTGLKGGLSDAVRSPF